MLKTRGADVEQMIKCKRVHSLDMSNVINPQG